MPSYGQQPKLYYYTLLGLPQLEEDIISYRSQQLKEEFEYIQRLSLRHAPPIKDLLASLIQFLSNGQETGLTLTRENQVSRLIDYLRSCRCLLILDNAESILRSGAYTGYYQTGYEDYGELLRRIGEVSHQSCLVITSREKPRDLVPLEGATLPVRALQLSGLKQLDGQEIIKLN